MTPLEQIEALWAAASGPERAEIRAWIGRQPAPYHVVVVAQPATPQLSTTSEALPRNDRSPRAPGQGLRIVTKG